MDSGFGNSEQLPRDTPGRQRAMQEPHFSVGDTSEAEACTVIQRFQDRLASKTP